MFKNFVTEINSCAQGIKCFERSIYKCMMCLGPYIIVTKPGLK